MQDTVNIQLQLNYSANITWARMEINVIFKFKLKVNAVKAFENVLNNEKKK